MRNILLVFFIYCLLGYILDLYVRVFSVKDFKLSKKDALKLLLNMPVYGTGGVLLYFILFIPCFQMLNFLPLLILASAIICTAVEFGYGYLFNIKLKLGLWDYSHMKIKLFGKEIPLNFMGQIEIIHSVLWGFIVLPVFYINGILA